MAILNLPNEGPPFLFLCYCGDWIGVTEADDHTDAISKCLEEMPKSPSASYSFAEAIACVKLTHSAATSLMAVSPDSPLGREIQPRIMPATDALADVGFYKEAAQLKADIDASNKS